MLLVPDKFVSLHWPRTGGTWATKQIHAGCPEAVRIGPEHAGHDDIPLEYRHLPVVSVVRDPVDWVESHYSHRRHIIGFQPDTCPLDQHRTKSPDMYVQDLITYHPGYMSQLAASYTDRADFVLRYENFAEWEHLLRTFGISCDTSTVVNSSPRTCKLSDDVAAAWRCSNADYCERYGYELPPAPVFALGDWAGHWRQTLELCLAPRFRGRPVDFLEVGICEGRGAVAAFETLLQHPGSTYTGVDVWAMSPRNRAERNIAAVSDGRHWIGEPTGCPATPEVFDVVYVDGEHTHEACTDDLRTYWPAVKPGGVLVVDDYGSDEWPSDYPGVRVAVDEWVSEHAEDLNVVSDGYQFIVQKKKA